jgi:DNA-binding LacI/PurR family transcriptional regulator
LIWPHFPTDIAQIKRINERVPTVLVDQRILGITTDSVRFDDVEGGKVVTKHLLELGHRRIAFLTDEVFAETVQARWQGYVLAHEEAGIVCDPKLSLLYQFIDADIFEPTMRRLYNLPDTRPTAIVCSNDVVAFGLLRFLNAEGIRVPEDMAVTGYGNSMPEYTNAISLTTIDQRFFDAGQEAARILCKRIHQPTSVRMHSPLDIVLPVRLVVRGSTAGANELPDRLSNRAFDAAKPNSGQA